MGKVEWTEKTWNPIKARRLDDGKVGNYCEKISAGCKNCYAEVINHRGMEPSGNGLFYIVENRPKVKIFLDEDILMQPLQRRKPTTYFLGSMTDLFGDWVTDEMLDRIFAVMALCPQHTFQVLTKRPGRMREYFGPCAEIDGITRDVFVEGQAQSIYEKRTGEDPSMWLAVHWPLPHVWLGVSVEDQQRADERIPELLRTPAAVRFVSYEPALGPVSFKPFLCRLVRVLYACQVCGEEFGDGEANARLCPHCMTGEGDPIGECEEGTGLDWLIIGGESGPGARPFNVAWARQAIRDCRAAGVRVFMKQLGAKPERCMSINAALDLERFAGTPIDRTHPMKLIDKKKGGEPSEWPEDLRVREWPGVIAATERQTSTESPDSKG